MKVHLMSNCFLICLLTFSFYRVHAQTLTPFVLSPKSPARIFSFTNKQSSFYCGVANGENSSGFHGITIAKEKQFENYWIMFGDEFLRREEATITVTPWLITRVYPEYNTKEEVFFADSLTLLAVWITSDYKGPITLIPAWSSVWMNTLADTLDAQTILLKNRLNSVVRIHFSEGRWRNPSDELFSRLKNPSPMLVPKVFIGQFERSMMFEVEFFARSSSLAPYISEELDELQRRKQERITQLVKPDDGGFQSSNEAMNQSYAWLRASLDALVMNQSGVGIYAGLPWFDDYWGRDTFISLPGAFLVTGDFESAKLVLRSFSAFQNKKAYLPDYGRIPNRITPTEISYNTVDATPWFARESYEYILYSGDVEFANEIFPALDMAIEGAKKFHLDTFGFLTHADPETWMDAVGDRGAWSPRGTRAVEVQALWITQLESSAAIARIAGKQVIADEWSALAKKVRENFIEQFTHPKEQILVDRLRLADVQDNQIRPNTLIALAQSLTPIAPEPLAFHTVRKTFEHCVYRYGVASLSQFDNGFHPYHQHPGFYPKDAAYHNGVIWTWLTGPAVTLLCRYGLQDSAFRLTQSLNQISQSQGQIGSLPELTDALSRNGHGIPEWSGTFSQAWSLAEYLRNLYQDYLGIHPNMIEKRVTLSPRLPKDMRSIEAIIRMGNSTFRVRYDFTDSKKNLTSVERLSGTDTIEVRLSLLHDHAHHTARLNIHLTRKKIEFIYNTSTNSFFGSSPDVVIEQNQPLFMYENELRSLRFCTPYLRRDLPALKSPTHPLLEGPVAASKNPLAPVIFEKSDPIGDDVGLNKKYSYPLNVNFQKGIFDITSMKVQSDNDMVYFRITMNNLSQPGWHPEYGFQLTMLALAIDIDGVKRSGSRYIRHNAQVVLPNDIWYERLILVGGGIQVMDKNDAILCEYIPTDERYPIGDVQTRTISFAIPVRYLGKPNKDWDYYLIAGGQDDHGGAGIGEFRTVLPIATEWNGGGNNEKAPNVYDDLKSR